MIAESVRREVIRLDGGECQLFHREPVPGTEIAHRVHQGIGGRPEDDPLNQPANLILACPECHRLLLHAQGYTIARWDRNDPIEGLIVVGSNGQEVPKDRLWFYVRQRIAEIVATAEAVGKLVRTIRRCQWDLGHALSLLKKRQDLLPSAGYETVYEVALEHGVSSSEAKKLIRVHQWAAKMDLDLTAMDPDIVDAIRKVPEEDLQKVLIAAQTLSLPDFWAIMHDKYGRKRQRIFRIFRGEYREVRARTEDEVEYEPGEVVVRGGSVIRGVAREVEDEDGEEDGAI